MMCSVLKVLVRTLPHLSSPVKSLQKKRLLRSASLVSLEEIGDDFTNWLESEFQPQGCFWQTQSPETEAVFLLGVSLLQYYQYAWAFSLPPGCPFLMTATALISPTCALDVGGNCFLPFLYLSIYHAPEGYCQFHLISKIFTWCLFVKPFYSSVYLWKSSMSYLKTINLVAGLRSICYVLWFVCATPWTSALLL